MTDRIKIAAVLLATCFIAISCSKNNPASSNSNQNTQTQTQDSVAVVQDNVPWKIDSSSYRPGLDSAAYVIQIFRTGDSAYTFPGTYFNILVCGNYIGVHNDPYPRESFCNWSYAYPNGKSDFNSQSAGGTITTTAIDGQHGTFDVYITNTFTNIKSHFTGSW